MLIEQRALKLHSRALLGVHCMSALGSLSIRHGGKNISSAYRRPADLANREFSVLLRGGL